MEAAMAQSESDRVSERLFMEAVPDFFKSGPHTPNIEGLGSRKALPRSKHGYKPPVLNEFETEIVSAWGQDGSLVESALMRWLAAAKANDRVDKAEYLDEWPKALESLSHDFGERGYSPLAAVMGFRRWFEERGLTT